ncbi:carbon starvation CstA family protein, partial [Burkholderia pseudomallei]
MTRCSRTSVGSTRSNARAATTSRGSGAPRDYLSTFLKIGTIVGLAIGILIVAPELKMPALTKFV